MTTRTRISAQATLFAGALLACMMTQAALALEPPAHADAVQMDHAAHGADAAHHASASASLHATSDSKAGGKLEFHTVPAGVRVTGELTGLEPDSMHGFHIHAVGDCSAADGKSAGPHFNPADMAHGRAGAGPHHAGDIPNQSANGKGIARIDEILHGVELGTGSDTDLVGRAVIVHADPDDYSSQPSGAAGARIACGVIHAN